MKVRRMSGENMYTVVLLYPDYLTGGEVETYLAWVNGKDPFQAVLSAQQQIFEQCEYDGGSSLDFVPLAVFEGHLTDYTPGSERCA